MAKYTIDNNGSYEDIDAENLSDAEEQAEDWIREGEWGDKGASVDCRITNQETEEEHWITVEIPPNEESLISDAVGPYDEICGNSPDDHDWTSEGEGGCKENPGVWSLGGTKMVTSQHCRSCGLAREEHVVGAQRNPGECDTVEYRMLGEVEIEQRRENGTMDPAEDEDDD